MRKNIKYIAAAFILVLAASCNKTDELSDRSVIGFEPQSVGTKATIDNNAGLQSQTFAVVGVMPKVADNFTNKIAYSNGGWAYTAPADAKYYWDTDPSAGAHKFFGYTDNGACALSNNVLTVTKVLTSADADQVDLLYSDPYVSTYAAWKADHGIQSFVPLHFQHLFSAVSIVLKNCTASSIVVNSVSVTIPNDGSATVDYSGNAAVVTPGTVSASETAEFIATPATDVSVAADGMMDVLKQATATAKTFMVVWPQTFAEDAPLTVHVKYTTGTGDNAYTNEVDVELPATAWVIGHKYDYTLGIYPTDIQLILAVQPWDEVEKDVTYGPDAVVNALALDYISGHAVKDSKRRTQNNFADSTNPIQAYFSVYAPTGTTQNPAKWLIRVTGATSKFTVTADNATTTTPTGKIEVTGNVAGRVHFTIGRATGENAPGASDEIQLNFFVVLNGREISMNSEITRGGALKITGKVGE